MSQPANVANLLDRHPQTGGASPFVQLLHDGKQGENQQKMTRFGITRQYSILGWQVGGNGLLPLEKPPPTLPKRLAEGWRRLAGRCEISANLKVRLAERLAGNRVGWRGLHSITDKVKWRFPPTSPTSPTFFYRCPKLHACVFGVKQQKLQRVWNNGKANLHQSARRQAVAGDGCAVD